MAPTFDDIRLAASRLAGTAIQTPLHTSPYLDEASGGRVFLKCENLQRTGSFKFRGAYNAIAALSDGERAAGVVACSSGNHAQGVAAAARLFGISATIVMPDDAPRAKLEGTRRLGARVVPYRRGEDDRDAIAAEIVRSTGARLVHPYNDPMVIAGQGTIGLEIVAEFERRGEAVDAVIVPCGGGGMSAGVNLAVARLSPQTEVHLVEPVGFDDYGRSLLSGQVERNAEATGSVCDALMARSPGPIGFEINRRLDARSASVADEEALRAVAFAFRALKLVVEPGGAAALAAVLSGRIPVRGRTVALVLSGGNVDSDMMARALASP